jgi:hypothetical protein
MPTRLELPPNTDAIIVFAKVGGRALRAEVQHRDLRLRGTGDVHEEDATRERLRVAQRGQLGLRALPRGELALLEVATDLRLGEVTDDEQPRVGRRVCRDVLLAVVDRDRAQ